MAEVASVPGSVAEAQARLRAAPVPSAVVEVARTIQRAGEQAVLVGGAVRDALIGLSHSDWDLATSATPAEVQAMFRKTIPTGLEHGTVTVMVRTDAGREPVEVTTFRGEGAYVDGRRPTEVTFHRDLVEDLARRDFTVNAFAWDPIAGVFSDPFDGLADLRCGLVRAVGNPAERFAEDGLRTMRAVRFCATRQLTLEPATKAAIEPALPVLDKVSRERVLVELTKLLLAPVPSRGLTPMAQTRMWGRVLPEIDEPAMAGAIEAVDALPARLDVRLARLLLPAPGPAREVGLNVLKPSRQLRASVLAIVSPQADALAAAAEPVDIRRAASVLHRDYLSDALLVRGVDPATALRAVAGAPLSTKELELKGGELISAGVLSPGPAVGRLLEALLDWVHEDPTRNTRDALLQRAAESAE